MIITNREELTKECKEVSIFESYDIVDKLVKELLDSSTGIGLSANQIGIDAKVCIIRMGKFSLDLVNPIITRSYDLKEFYNEGCLSFPNEFITTARFNEIYFYDALQPAGMIATGIESVIIQHEIDHLNGVTMHNRKIKIPEKNQKCWCGDGKKYKKCHYGSQIK